MNEERMKHELPQKFVKDVVGYCDPLSVLPGETVGFKLSKYGEPDAAQLELVELISGDDRPHGTGLIERHIDTTLPYAVDLVHQPLVPGSFGEVQGLGAQRPVKVSIWLYPTLLRDTRQTILQWGSLSLQVSNAGIYSVWAEDEIDLPFAVPNHRWLHVELSFGETSHLSCRCQPLGVGEEAQLWEAAGGSGAADSINATLLLACSSPGEAHFNGRLEAPKIVGAEGVIGEWDFAEGMASQRFSDISGNDHHGQLYQHPTRAVTGRLWDASVQRFAEAPEQYAAIHFHEDDITDAGWHDTVSLVVPDNLPSGQYALKVTCGKSEDYVPFFVRAPRERRQAIAYLAPTASYLAYANQRLGFTGGPFGMGKLFDANQAFLSVHEDVGYSMYEYHRDHSGVHFSSRLRPILNLKPRSPTWAFNADTHITAWLHNQEHAYDVVTDEDLHRDGEEALAGYQVVITGTHPEYYSSQMREGLESWLKDNGRLIYMGGNGFYWRVAFDPENPAVMEVRRAEDGTRAWIAEPGEYYHQFTGEYGGMWRRLGRPPNDLVGIGFAAQGFDGGTYYRVQPGALDERVAFALEGFELGETFGGFGNQGGGAAGEEIDRFDPELGSPAHAVIIASSENHRPGMLRVKEEFHMMEPPTDDPKVRADMVFFEVPGGGAVFSTGSISYAGSFAHNDYDNEICQITDNVLRRFADPVPFPLP